MLKSGAEGPKLWPFGLVEFWVQFRKAADTLSIKDIVPDAAFGPEHRHQQAIQNAGCDNEEGKVAKRQDSDEVRKTCAHGTGVSVMRHACRAYREVRRSARGGDPWARRTRCCAAAVKGEVVVEIGEGHGQVARACEDRGLEAKTWLPGGIVAA